MSVHQPVKATKAELLKLVDDIAFMDPMGEYDTGSKFCFFCYGEECGGSWKPAALFFWAPGMLPPKCWVAHPVHDDNCPWLQARKFTGRELGL